jgi:hypothetical protein
VEERTARGEKSRVGRSYIVYFVQKRIGSRPTAIACQILLPPARAISKNAHWLSPVIVAEVQFARAHHRPGALVIKMGGSAPSVAGLGARRRKEAVTLGVGRPRTTMEARHRGIRQRARVHESIIELCCGITPPAKLQRSVCVPYSAATHIYALVGSAGGVPQRAWARHTVPCSRARD